jgi:hypothetical protein
MLPRAHGCPCRVVLRGRCSLIPPLLTRYFVSQYLFEHVLAQGRIIVASAPLHGISYNEAPKSDDYVALTRT